MIAVIVRTSTETAILGAVLALPLVALILLGVFTLRRRGRERAGSRGTGLPEPPPAHPAIAFPSRPGTISSATVDAPPSNGQPSVLNGQSTAVLNRQSTVLTSDPVVPVAPVVGAVTLAQPAAVAQAALLDGPASDPAPAAADVVARGADLGLAAPELARPSGDWVPLAAARASGAPDRPPVADGPNPAEPDQAPVTASPPDPINEPSGHVAASAAARPSAPLAPVTVQTLWDRYPVGIAALTVAAVVGTTARLRGSAQRRRSRRRRR